MAEVTKESLLTHDLSEFVDENTTYPHYYPKSEEELKNMKASFLYVYKRSKITVVEINEELVFVFLTGEEKAKAVFSIYEFHGVHIDEDRMMVVAYGHENVMIYFVEDEDFTNIHTR